MQNHIQIRNFMYFARWEPVPPSLQRFSKNRVLSSLIYKITKK